MNKIGSNKQIALILVGALLLGFIGGAIGNRTVGVIDTPDVTNKTVAQEVVDESSAMIDAIAQVRPAVVSIIATKDLQVVRRSPFDPFLNNRQPQQVETRRQQVSGGTGFIIESHGLVITNRHVVLDDTADYSVLLNDGKEYRAEVVSKDPANDLAVVQILENETGNTKPVDLPFVELGNSDQLEVGQRVIAIGNALGEFQNTVTSGIISAESRQIEASDSNGGNRDVLSNLLQTDAAINQGNSGGPLINLAGQVVGVNTAVASNGNDIGFAIPVDDVKPVIESVRKFGKIVRPQLGVRYTILTPAQAEERNLSITHGALLIGAEEAGMLAVIPDSPAEKAGLKPNDVIIEVDGLEINEQYGLRDAVRNKQPGDKVNLMIWRDGNELSVVAELEAFEN